MSSASSGQPANPEQPRPLAGVRVIEFTHMVMGPAAGAILAELGADVIRIEPVRGDATRHLKGSGAGYFPMYNRGKKSACVDIKHPQGLEVARKLIGSRDVLLENFRPGTLDRLGLDYESLSAVNPGLIYCSAKGFLAGPYERRTALDEVAQMMSGLAYMTGPPGKPLRAGASVIDVTGGLFGVIAIFAALLQRHATGRGQKVTSALFETSVYLVGQHMAQKAVTGQAAQPMPVRVSAWAIYDVFQTRDGEQVFLGVVSDGLWQQFCEKFDLPEFARDPRYRTNNQRVQARAQLLPRVRALFAAHSKAELIAKLEKTDLPFAPVSKPEDLFEDRHLLASDGLAATRLSDGSEARLPVLPIELDHRRPLSSGELAQPGEHTREVLLAAGIDPQELDSLEREGVIASSPDQESRR
jgi:crotonobetainyl-CoA:carnitine CoA-transferase CaiB-like acyl-CoA transferase